MLLKEMAEFNIHDLSRILFIDFSKNDDNDDDNENKDNDDNNKKKNKKS